MTRLAHEAAGADGVGIVAPTGKAGSVLMFHGNLVHASPPNITPYPRKIVYLTLCAVSNHITKFTRPEWIAHRDFTPIVPVGRRCAARIRARAPRRGGIDFLNFVRARSVLVRQSIRIRPAHHRSTAVRPFNCRTWRA